MRRVTFAPEGPPPPAGARPHGGHCRLLFPGPRGGTDRARAFTCRRWHGDGGFDVDFAVHDGTGPAAHWLRRAQPGDMLGWRHGGAPKASLDEPCADPATLIADATALPLLAALCETAHPRRALRLLLLAPDGPVPGAGPDGAKIEVTRVPDAGAAIAALRPMAFGAESLVLAACEAGEMRRLRRFALDELGLPRPNVVTSGYWKRGLTTEEVDVAKHEADWFADPAPQRA